MLSHGHWDHAGASLRALQIIRDHNGGKRLPFYTHPDMFRRRGTKNADGTMRVMEDVPSVQALTDYGADVVVTREPQFPLGGLAYVSGEIPRVTAYEKGMPGQHRATLDGKGWELDELLIDERFLAIHVRGKGLVVFSACSHAGIVNVLSEARAQFPSVPIYAALGGLHLSGPNERIISETVADLAQFDLAVIAAGHCTGWRALSALAQAFGDKRLAPLAVGKTYRF